MLDQFDRLKKRNAFLEQYKKERMFENGLEEFDDARYESYHGSGVTTVNDSCGYKGDCGRTAEGVQSL
jgi:hypothetical protein